MAWPRQDREGLVVAGAALVSTGLVMGGMAWLVRRQIQSGDVVKLKLVHSADDELSRRVDELTGLLREYLPRVTTLSEQGLDVNMRLKSRT